jgi:hypothetical protein
LPLARKLFIAERNISIFGRIADLLPADQDIVVGGSRPGATPIPAFEELLRKFPNTGEVDRYAAARVASILGDYFTPMKDAQGRYEAYLARRRSMLKGAPLRQPELRHRPHRRHRYLRPPPYRQTLAACGTKRRPLTLTWRPLSSSRTQRLTRRPCGPSRLG